MWFPSVFSSCFASILRTLSKTVTFSSFGWKTIHFQLVLTLSHFTKNINCKGILSFQFILSYLVVFQVKFESEFFFIIFIYFHISAEVWSAWKHIFYTIFKFWLNAGVKNTVIFVEQEDWSNETWCPTWIMHGSGFTFVDIGLLLFLFSWK